MISTNLLHFLVVYMMCTVESFTTFTVSCRQKKNEGVVKATNDKSIVTIDSSRVSDYGMDESYVVRRRDFLHIPLVAIGVAAIEDMFPKVLSKAAHAAYGDSTNIELPSYIDFLIEKNKQADPSSFLYQGADRDAQLNRLKTAISYLETLPAVIRSRKWSQVQGIITGPLGTLTATMRQISESNKEAQKIAAKVKLDLFNVGLFSTSKDVVGCLAASEAALLDLVEFVKIAL
jgi:hypothetical protein